MEKVYLISRGEYSDYRVVGAFSTLEKAQQFIKEANEAENSTTYKINDEIEELNVDSLTIPKDLHPFTVYFKKDTICGIEPDYVEDMKTSLEQWGIGKKLSCWAKDEQHAAKIANEIKAQLIALNQWDDDAKSSS